MKSLPWFRYWGWIMGSWNQNLLLRNRHSFAAFHWWDPAYLCWVTKPRKTPGEEGSEGGIKHWNGWKNTARNGCSPMLNTLGYLELFMSCGSACSKFLACRALLVPESVGIEQLAKSGHVWRCFLCCIKYLFTTSDITEGCLLPVRCLEKLHRCLVVKFILRKQKKNYLQVCVGAFLDRGNQILFQLFHLFIKFCRHWGQK